MPQDNKRQIAISKRVYILNEFIFAQTCLTETCFGESTKSVKMSTTAYFEYPSQNLKYSKQDRKF